jgi:hypothetical protein
MAAAAASKLADRAFFIATPSAFLERNILGWDSTEQTGTAISQAAFRDREFIPLFFQSDAVNVLVKGFYFLR